MKNTSVTTLLLVVFLQCQHHWQMEDVTKLSPCQQSYPLLLVVILHVKIKWRTLPSWAFANRAIHSCWWWFYMSKSNRGCCQAEPLPTELYSWWWFYNAKVTYKCRMLPSWALANRVVHPCPQSSHLVVFQHFTLWVKLKAHTTSGRYCKGC